MAKDVPILLFAASKFFAFNASTIVCASSVGVTHDRGGVGTGTVSDRELLFSSLSATRFVESTTAVTGLLELEKKRAVVSPTPNPFTVCSRPFTLTVKLPAAACPLFVIPSRTPIGSPGRRQLVFCNSIFICAIVRSGSWLGAGLGGAVPETSVHVAPPSVVR